MKNHFNLFVNNKRILLFIILTFNFLIVNSQCLTSGGIGSFINDTTFESDWFSASEGNATFSTTTLGSYYGSASLKIEVRTDSPSQVRMFNRNECYFDMNSGEEYTVSFYAKGTIGNKFTVTLMDTGVNIETINQEVVLDEWTFYTLKFTSNVTTTNGRIRFNFLEEGIYEIDELIVKTGGFNTWYVSPTGEDSLGSNNGLSVSSPLRTIGYAVNTAWSSGDIIYVMDGTYQNNNYGNGVDNGQVVSVNTVGTLNGPLVIRNNPGDIPKIQFDGSGGFICNQAQYLEISGFEIQGPNQQITKAEAEANRLNPTNYYKGRGIAIWASSGGDHIILHSNKVYDCPASGIRINNSDYCTITNNEVYNCTKWSSAGESAIVLAQSKNIDLVEKIKMRITKNKVYNNVNNIHYFNSSYACSNPSSYGCKDYPNIIDGSGCYITRNNDRQTGGNDENPNGQYIGYFYFANNISYGNGINGLVVHKSDNSIVMNNTSYINGGVPLSEGRQNAVGITVNNSKGVRLYNNIVWTAFTTDVGFQYFGTIPILEADIVGANNMLINGMSKIEDLGFVTSNPLFTDETNFDFTLTGSSPAVDTGVIASEISPLTGTSSAEYIPLYDFDNNSKIGTVSDIGAFEYIDSSTLSIDNFNNTFNNITLYPNPTTDVITLSGLTSNSSISIYDILGKRQIFINNPEVHTKEMTLDIRKLKSGVYFVKINDLKNHITIKLLKK